MKFNLRSFRAIDDIPTWRDYMEGHADVLREFGIVNLTSHKEDWIENPNVYVIVAYDDKDHMIGGIKVHSFHPDFKLPVELAIGELDPKISSMVMKSQQNQGAGEICGLWIAMSHGRLGLAHYLSRCAITLCPRIGCLDIYGISSPFTLNMFLQLGYHVITELGDQGNYEYPTKEFISTAVMISNTKDLPLALEEHRERIKSLRENPKQRCSESLAKTTIEINYNLSEVLS
jgi:hypothetical protein